MDAEIAGAHCAEPLFLSFAHYKFDFCTKPAFINHFESVCYTADMALSGWQQPLSL